MKRNEIQRNTNNELNAITEDKFIINRKSFCRNLFILLTVMTVLVIGCDVDEGKETAITTSEKEEDADPDDEDDVDAVSTPSVATDEESLIKAMSEEGSWIIILTSDLKAEKDIVLEGEFEKPDRDDTTKLVPAPRKIALYAQDADRNKTDSFVLEATTLTIKSKDAKIQGGTFRGDVYIEATGFQVIDGEIDGNVYFLNEEVEGSFDTENGGSVTGTSIIKEQEED